MSWDAAKGSRLRGLSRRYGCHLFPEKWGGTAAPRKEIKSGS